MPIESDGTTGAAGTPAPSGQQRYNSNHARRDRRNNRSGPNSVRRDVNTTRFEGREPSLKGFIYDYSGERKPDQFIKTTKEVVNYVGRTYTKYTAEFTQAVRDWLLRHCLPSLIQAMLLPLKCGSCM